MNNGFNHKMYNWEVNPPVTVWEKIAGELDASDLDAKYPSTLLQAAVPPPSGLWQKIESALSEPLSTKVAEKLLALEVVPEAHNWIQIEKHLDNEKSTGSLKRIFPFIRYAAAAAILVFITVFGIRFFNSNKTESEIAKTDNYIKTVPAKVTTGTNQDLNIGVTGVAASIEEARSDAALEESKQTYAKLDFTSRKKKLDENHRFFNSEVSDDIPGGITRGLYEEDPSAMEELSGMDIRNRYALLMTPDGNIIRMSKKLKDIVCCVSGADQDKDCTDQLKLWRDKISNPAISHATGNFLEIINMIHSLQDN